MAYEKQTWEDYPSTNTPITSNRLNHIEQGIYDNSTDIISTATQLRNEMKTNIITNQEVATNEYLNNNIIYKRLIVAEVENSSGTSIDINIPSFSYTEMWIDESDSFITNSDETLAINWYLAPDDYSRVWINKSTGKIRYRMGGNLSGRTFYIVLKYTKQQSST